MQCKYEGRRVYFLDPTPQELKWIQKKLTWEGHPEKQTFTDPASGEEIEQSVAKIETLLFIDEALGLSYTYHGLFEPLKQVAQFPMDLVDEVPRHFSRIHISKNILPGVELHDYQVAAVAKAAMIKLGITEIPTGGGKTEIILALLRHLISEGQIKKALIVVPSTGLCEQMYERAMVRGFAENEIGRVNAEFKEFDRTIVVAVVNSINVGLKESREQVVDLIANCDFVGYDETHHLRASSWIQIAELAKNANYLLGWSGSPFQGDTIFENSGDALMYGLMGRVIFTETYDHLLEIGQISQAIVHMALVPGRLQRFMASFRYVYDKFIVENDTRNEMIANYARMFVLHGFSTLILIQRKEHAQRLMLLLHDLDPITILGGKKGMAFDGNELENTIVDYNIFREKFAAGHYKVVIASSVMDEGMDVPNIGALIMAGGGKSKIKARQRTGRGARKKKIGPQVFYVLDFNDRTHVFLASHSKKRQALYEEMRAVMIEDRYQFVNMVIAHGEHLRALESNNED
jgi:superfamily II DNA or RNA helicase